MKLLKQLVKRVHSDDRNLNGAMQRTLTKGSVSPNRKFAPWRPLPNVADFRVEVAIWDELFLKFGIHKRSNTTTFVYKKYRNRDLNRFIEHQIIRLEKASPKAYWRIATHLMKRSRVWYMMSVRHVYPNWHRDMHFEHFLRLRRRYLELCDSPRALMEIARVYIQKKNGKWRPLGVPKPLWRIYLHTWNQFLVKFLDHKLPDWQHGFRPGRGTLTAWKQILSQIIDKPYIFEGDFKGFFDNVKLGYIGQTLEQMDVPSHIIEYLMHINKSLVKLTSKDLVEEAEREITLDANDNLNPNWEDYEELPVDWFDLNAVYNTFIKNPKGFYYSYKEKGVPQGAPTSPFLSIVALCYAMGVYVEELTESLARILPWSGDKESSKHKLEGSTKEEVELVGYADDWLMASDKPFEVDPEAEALTEAGIYVEPEKSGWVRKDGKWLKSLDFLGLSYDGIKDELRANTRNGSRLIYDKQSLIEAAEGGYVESKTSESPTGNKSWDSFVRSRFAGFVMSRLYNGSWNQEDLWQNFELTFKKGTWVAQYNRWASQLKWKNPILRPGSLPKWRTRILHPGYSLLPTEEALRLTVFNSTSLATRSALEALRISEGMKPRNPVPQEPESDDEEDDREDDPTVRNLKNLESGGRGDGRSWESSTYWDRRNMARWMTAYCGSPTDYKIFIYWEIARMRKYSKFTREQMWVHYMGKYPGRKIKQIEHVLQRGNRLIVEIKETLRSLQ